MDKANWTPALREEARAAAKNGHVGQALVSETDDYRVWLIDLAPGERLAFHTHVMNYFWVATTAGRARSHHVDGRVAERDYAVGDVQHMRFGAGESMTHDLENIGTTQLAFITVEDKRSANAPLEL